ncbi:lipocalin-like domain-containing protein [Nitrosomonas aestuarii]|uniref:lipocalin-like domain-containing protein n=1 Tax=Nitrosomonas aestuarii TaxID=52441 RepID=UPI000D2F5634|nr:carotenoid 1,2-hydratase [Nitrosomonas aestuarii]PTN11018.1 putative secreted hydrolase [Nitrosomonas aestuarii]
MQNDRYKQYIFIALILLAAWLAFPVSQLLAEGPRYKQVVPHYDLTFPQDYGAHPDFRIEWWYVTGWLETSEKKPLGFQITFFRPSTGHNPENPSQFAPKQLIIGHAALSDPAVGRLIYDEKTARAGFGLAYAREGDTDVKLDDWYFVRSPDGSYTTEVQADKFGLHLTLKPSQSLMLQGKKGFSRKGPDIEQASYYYSKPHLQVSGIIRHQGQTLTVKGHAWLDHEWSSELLDSRADGWDWVSVNLDDGSALMAFQIRGKNDKKLWAYAKLRDANGHEILFAPEQVEFIPVRTWQSPHTNATYPVEMRIRTDKTEWRLMPLFDDQELDSRSSTGAVYWEGAVTVFRDEQKVGRGYLELTGYVESLDL